MAKKNYSYGKITNGVIEYAPNRLIVTVTDEDGTTRQAQAFNAPAEQYAAQGWLPVVKTPQPEAQSGGYYSTVYAQNGEEIVQSWEFVEYPTAQEVTRE